MKPRWSQVERDTLLSHLGPGWTLRPRTRRITLKFLPEGTKPSWHTRGTKYENVLGVEYALEHPHAPWDMRFKSLENFARAIEIIRFSDVQARADVMRSLHLLREIDAKSVIVAAEVKNETR